MSAPRIIITPTAYVDLILEIDLCPVEIQSLGRVEICGEERRIVDNILFPQKCTGGGTELDRYDPNSYLHYWAELIRQGRSEETNWQRLWCHSHVDMGARFSGIDHENIERFGRATANDSKFNPWWISIVGNKRHELSVRLDIFWPERKTFEDLPLELDGHYSKDELWRLYYKRRGKVWEEICKNVRIVSWLGEDDGDRDRSRADEDEDEGRRRGDDDE